MRRHSCIRTLLQLLIIAVLPLGVSQAESEPTWEPCHSVCVARTVTQSGRVRVVITKQKPRLYLAKTQRILLVLDDDDTDYYNELPDVQVGYRRPELIDQSADIDLPDEIKLRLAIARMKAIAAYTKKWA
jgi:hypothetical protein